MPARVLWCNFDLARQLGFSVPRDNRLSRRLEQQLVHAFSLRALQPGAGPDYEDVKAIGQVVKGDEEFATARLEEAGEVEPRLRGLSEGRVAFEVARSGGLGVEELRGSGRRRKLSEARAVAGYLGKRLAGISLARMARYFHRDESTLVREVNHLEQRLTADARARRRLAAIVKQLRARPPRWK